MEKGDIGLWKRNKGGENRERKGNVIWKREV